MYYFLAGLKSSIMISGEILSLGPSLLLSFFLSFFLFFTESPVRLSILFLSGESELAECEGFELILPLVKIDYMTPFLERSGIVSPLTNPRPGLPIKSGEIVLKFDKTFLWAFCYLLVDVLFTGTGSTTFLLFSNFFPLLLSGVSAKLNVKEYIYMNYLVLRYY